MSLAPGNRLGPYEIVAPIGAGGMGEVYKARDRRLDRLVAIKVSEAKFSERFEREARAVGSLNHPNICQLYDVGPDYLVMELIEGSPLGQVENLRKLLDMAVQMADGMAAAHAAGIVHRDLKPANILVTREGLSLIHIFDPQKRRSVSVAFPALTREFSSKCSTWHGHAALRMIEDRRISAAVLAPPRAARILESCLLYTSRCV